MFRIRKKYFLKCLEIFLTLKIGISRSNLISSRSEDFRMFSYVIWRTENEKDTEKNDCGILDLENLQSRSHFMFCMSESWRWLSSAIDALKWEKQWEKSSKHLWPWNRDFQGQGSSAGIFYYFLRIQRIKLHMKTF